MSLLLAVEPDSKQSAILKDIARRQLGAALVIVRSTDEAVAAIQKRLPDLILMSALVPPRDEAELNDHLRGVAGAEHIQTVSIPLLAHSTPKRPRGRGFDTFRRKRGKAVAASGCDPSIFGAEIAAYLKQVEELRPTRPEEEHQTEDLPAAVRPDVSSLVEDTALFVEETAPFVNEPPPPILEDPPLPLACLAGVLAPPAPALAFAAAPGAADAAPATTVPSAALGRPTGCRIHKRKRTPPRRFRAGQRPPEPLIIVSKRMLELG